MPTNDNVLILQRLRGVSAQEATLDNDTHPHNPNARRDPRDARHCSFCGTAEYESGYRVIQGAIASICERCVNDARDKFDGKNQ
jgi:hypothetical protein